MQFWFAESNTKERGTLGTSSHAAPPAQDVDQSIPVLSRRRADRSCFRSLPILFLAPEQPAPNILLCSSLQRDGGGLQAGALFRAQINSMSSILMAAAWPTAAGCRRATPAGRTAAAAAVHTAPAHWRQNALAGDAGQQLRQRAAAAAPPFRAPALQRRRGALLTRAAMFDGLSRSLEKAWDSVRKDGKLTAENIKGPLRDIRWVPGRLTTGAGPRHFTPCMKLYMALCAGGTRRCRALQRSWLGLALFSHAWSSSAPASLAASPTARHRCQALVRGSGLACRVAVRDAGPARVPAGVRCWRRMCRCRWCAALCPRWRRRRWASAWSRACPPTRSWSR